LPRTKQAATRTNKRGFGPLRGCPDATRGWNPRAGDRRRVGDVSARAFRQLRTDRSLPNTSAVARAPERRRTRARPAAVLAQLRTLPACEHRARHCGVHHHGEHAAPGRRAAQLRVGGEHSGNSSAHETRPARRAPLGVAAMDNGSLARADPSAQSCARRLLAGPNTAE
jgi:hypothetical protein